MISIFRTCFIKIFFQAFIVVFFILTAFEGDVSAQTQNFDIPPLISAFKKDPRGPYQAIKWFCPDGRILPANERCGQPGSIQHAFPKDIVQDIALKKHIFLGQILAGTPYASFLDAANQNSRLKQYQLEKFLHSIDDGWIQRRARFYRGAIQAEDESAWGNAFLKTLCANDEFVRQQYYLLRESFKDIPHNAADIGSEEIRSLATVIADTMPTFMDIRIKLHGQPEFSDAQRVREFRSANLRRFSRRTLEKIDRLLKQLDALGQPANTEILRKYASGPLKTSAIGGDLQVFLQRHGNYSTDNRPQFCVDVAALIWQIRNKLPAEKDPARRLEAIDVSIVLEKLLFREAIAWNPGNLRAALKKGRTLALAAAGCGFVEIWEWHELESALHLNDQSTEISIDELLKIVTAIRRVTEWGGAMVRATYQTVVDRFAEFEPLAYGFIDDRIRGSILLQVGKTASVLGDLTARHRGITGRLMGLRYQTDIRGLNPGYALGELVVITGSPDHIDFSDRKIYFLQRSTPELKPVAGIATVNEGNPVSHVQLLARNLGIPNAVVSEDALQDLVKHNGETVFYAVSNGGTVLVKPAEEMTAEERELVEKKQRSEDRIKVPVNKLDLKTVNFISLNKLRAASSGKVCGPKAANLGQLKSIFPNRVVNGFAIPFGVFRQHMDLPIPGSAQTYWERLTAIFRHAESQRRSGKDSQEIEQEVIRELGLLSKAIRDISFMPGFLEKLRDSFQMEFNCLPGEKAVFIRSDTNMEDLSEFTGAGLNLTIFNVLQEEKVLQGIRDVWASPFSERSYRWRQKFLLNPENVYPSIVIMPTVNNDNSGVMITSGVSSNNPDDLTISFSRGPGGAVEGQAAETYLLEANGSKMLLSPARETRYNYLPASGGIERHHAYFDQPVLNAEHLRQLRLMGEEIRRRLPGTPGIESNGPFDVELGFQKNHLWLFQVRPFVENKRAKSTEYLRKLESRIPAALMIDLQQPVSP